MRKMTLLILMIGFYSNVSNAALTTSGAVSMKRNKDQFFLAEVTINQKYPAQLIVDTGASEIILTDWLAHEMNLALTKSDEESADSAGKSFPVFRAKVASLKVGNQTNQDLNVPIIHIPPLKKEGGVSGLFSPQSFFAGTPILIDFPNAELRWGKETDLGKRKILASMKVQNCSNHESGPLIGLKINGVAGKFLIDTGGFKSVLTAKFAKKLGPLSTTVSSRSGISGRRQVKSVQSLRIELENIASSLAADIEERANGCPEADGKLGIDWIGNYGVLVSADRQKISFAN